MRKWEKPAKRGKGLRARKKAEESQRARGVLEPVPNNEFDVLAEPDEGRQIYRSYVHISHRLRMD